LLDIIIPAVLSLFVGPGVGQLYNRQYKKGTYLIVLSLLVLTGLIAWCFKAAKPYLPTDLATVDPAALQPMIGEAAKKIANSHAPTLFVYQLLLGVLWFYSVIDAIMVAMRRRARKQAQQPQ
jgi:TM2 domain-containing membrane protein YozV